MSSGDEIHRVVVTGVGAVSPLGDSPAAIHAALVEGRSGLRPVELGEIDGFGALPAAHLKAGHTPAGHISFEPRDYLPKGNLRPLDRTGRLVIAAAQLALDAAGWTPELRAEHEVGLVLGTMYCSAHTISKFDCRALEAGPKYAKPFEFANSVLNAAAGQTAIWHDLRGINSTVAGGATAGLQALAYAVEMIRNGRAEVLLAGGGEELCFETFYGFHRAGLLSGSGGPPRGSGDGCPVPFDARRDGFALGEGAALLVLEDRRAALARGAQVLAELRGHACAYDVSRGGDRERSREAVARTLRLALDDGGLAAGDVDAVSASGNGSVAGDLHEALGIADTFADGVGPPVTAVKSMLGESLGASGAFQLLALIESMRRGVLPGIRGLETVDDDFPLAALSAKPRELALARGLVSTVGLDGNVCALAVERGTT